MPVERPDFYWDLQGVRQSGLRLSIGRPIYGDGPILAARGHEQIAERISNRPELAKYREFEIANLYPGGPSLFLATEDLVTWPQVFLGYEREHGLPILLGMLKAIEAHMAIVGQPGTGKSASLASICEQLARHGVAVWVIDTKGSPELREAVRHGAEAKTKLDAEGNPVGLPFTHFTLEPETPTSGWNWWAENRDSMPAWQRASILLKGLGLDNGDGPEREYFRGATFKFFERLPRVGSFRELEHRLQHIKLPKDEEYRTAGGQDRIAGMAKADQLNLPSEHPANIDLGQTLQARGCLYWNLSALEAGPFAKSVSGLALQAGIHAARQARLSEDRPLVLAVDECQNIPLPIVTHSVEQTRSSMVRLILTWHALSQLRQLSIGDFTELLMMVNAKLVFGAVPGRETARWLEAMFGLKKETRVTLQGSRGRSDGQGESVTFTEMGPRITLTNSSSDNDQTGFGMQEAEVRAWDDNLLAELNYDQDRYVLQVDPGAEYCRFPFPIVAQRGGFHISREEFLRRREALPPSGPNTFIPGKESAKALAAPPPSPALSAEEESKHARWLAYLGAAHRAIDRNFENAGQDGAHH